MVAAFGAMLHKVNPLLVYLHCVIEVPLIG